MVQRLKLDCLNKASVICRDQNLEDVIRKVWNKQFDITKHT